MGRHSTKKRPANRHQRTYKFGESKAAAFRRKLRRKLGRERCQQRGSYRMIVAKARKVDPDATD